MEFKPRFYVVVKTKLIGNPKVQVRRRRFLLPDSTVWVEPFNDQSTVIRAKRVVQELNVNGSDIKYK